jgi:hypothetical protein
MNSKILFVDDEPRKIDSFISELQLVLEFRLISKIHYR